MRMRLPLSKSGWNIMVPTGERWNELVIVVQSYG
jgi:hypothetical protein